MTLHWVIIACMAFVIVARSLRGRPGDALGDIVVLVLLFAAIGAIDLIVSRFTYTGNVGLIVAAVIAGGFALDALYGLMAPERRRERDAKLRKWLRRRPA